MNKEPDKYSATWVSHSSMGDFLKCQRLYYLHNVYKNPKTGKKINITCPPLALGVAVHEVLEPLSWILAEERLNQPFQNLYDKAWESVSGKLGGFKNSDEESIQKARGWDMIQRVINNPEPILKPAIRIGKSREDLPHYFLSPEDNIIICGKVDWLQYDKDKDGIEVLDFKTGKNEESDDSLQLPIYMLLVSHFKTRPITGASYWYLEKDNIPQKKLLPSKEEAFERVIDIALKVKEAREEGEMKCLKGRCKHCDPFEKIIEGAGEFVGVGNYKQEMYIVK